MQQIAEKSHRAAHHIIREEAIPPGDNVGHVLDPQAFFHQLGLPVGAVEHGDIGKTQRAAALRCGGLHIEHIDTADHAVDLFRKEKRLGKIVLRRHEPHAFAPRAHGGELAFRPVVMGNQGEGAAQYFRRGAVIFRETDLTCARMLRRKTVKASRARSAEAINRLIRVADEKHALPAAAPFLNQLVLDFVAVLKFIHEKMGEGRIKLQSVKQQIVKITHAVFPQPGAVALVGFRVRRRFDNAAFHLGNLLQKLPRGELQLHFL